MQATFEQARKATTATGKLPAADGQRKAAALADAAAKIVELIGPEKVRVITDDLRRPEAVAREWRRRNATAESVRLRPMCTPMCTPPRRHVGARQPRPRARRTVGARSRADSRGDPGSSEGGGELPPSPGLHLVDSREQIERWLAERRRALDALAGRLA